MCGLKDNVHTIASTGPSTCLIDLLQMLVIMTKTQELQKVPASQVADQEESAEEQKKS